MSNAAIAVPPVAYTAVIQIAEIYVSLQGESLWAGLPTTFVRTVGCPVRCHYCDTAYAFSGGERRTVADVVAAVDRLGVRRVCLTGGEPLAQASSRALLQRLVAAGYAVSLETSGVRSIGGLPRPLKVVLDLKTPGSGVHDAWLPATVAELLPGDELKVVCVDRADFDWLCAWLDRHRVPSGVQVSVSPVAPHTPAADLADWILASGRDLRLNLQLHKVLWPEADRSR